MEQIKKPIYEMVAVMANDAIEAIAALKQEINLQCNNDPQLIFKSMVLHTVAKPNNFAGRVDISYMAVAVMEKFILQDVVKDPEKFFCREYDGVGFVCEEQCERCKKTNDFTIPEEPADIPTIDRYRQ